MPGLFQIETRIRETCENDTAVELRLDSLAETALRLRDQIVADRRIDDGDLPALVNLLDLVPTLRQGCATSLAYNRQVNGLFGRLASDRRTAARWGTPDPDDGGAAAEQAA